MITRLAALSPWYAGGLALTLLVSLVLLGWFRGLSIVAGGAFAIGLLLLVQGARANAALVRRRSVFVSRVTHELKTPVAAIRAAGETLLSGRLSDDEARLEYARLVVEQAKRLTRLLDNLLAYARMTDVTEGYDFQPVPLELLVEDALRGWRGQLERDEFDLTVDVPDDLPPVRADRTSFELLLDNVIANAVTYSTDTRSLSLVARTAGRAVTLDVVDRGIGIPSDEVAQVTRRFYRGRRSSPGGSGLGLAIADRIARDHGASLTIHSTLDEGTTVRVTLPAAEARRS